MKFTLLQAGGASIIVGEVAGIGHGVVIDDLLEAKVVAVSIHREIKTVSFKITNGLKHFFLRMVILRAAPITKPKIAPHDQSDNTQHTKNNFWISFNPLLRALYFFSEHF